MLEDASYKELSWPLLPPGSCLSNRLLAVLAAYILLEREEPSESCQFQALPKA